MAAAAAPVTVRHHSRCIGHRGLPLLYPENTLQSFRAALDTGADGIELDIRLTKDNVIVVFHDTTLDRATDSTGEIGDFNYAELRSVLAKSTFLGLNDAFPPSLAEPNGASLGSKMITDTPPQWPEMRAPIPRLVDVFELLLEPRPVAATCIIDIKWDNPTTIMVHLRKLLSEPQYNALLPRLTLGVWSLQFALLFPPAASCPVRRAFIGSSCFKARMLAPFVDTISLDKDVALANPNFVRSMRARKKHVTVWTADSITDIQRLLSLQVDGLISDFVPSCMAAVSPLPGARLLPKDLCLEAIKILDRGSATKMSSSVLPDFAPEI